MEYSPAHKSDNYNIQDWDMKSTMSASKLSLHHIQQDGTSPYHLQTLNYKIYNLFY